MKLVADLDPDVILQAIKLPDIGGFELLRQLRSTPRGADRPIVALTGFLSPSEQIDLSTASFNEVLTKPVESSILIQTIHNHLRPRTSGEPAAGAQLNVLLVDDNPAQLRAMHSRLRKLGFVVTCAKDGAEALSAAQRLPFDAVISDLIMPKMDGIELCQAIRADPRLTKLPVVLVSSFVEEADHELAQKIGANALVARSGDMEEELRALAESIRRGAPKESVKNLGSLPEAYFHRAIVQLERQATVNWGLTQRCTLQSLLLSIVASLSNALARRVDIESAIADALITVVDVSGVSKGLVFLAASGQLSRLVASSGCTEPEKRYFGEPGGMGEVLARVMAQGEPIRVPSQVSSSTAAELRDSTRLESAILVPLLSRDQRIGVLLLGSTDKTIESEDWLAFARTVGVQIGQAIALSEAVTERTRLEQMTRAKEEADRANEFKSKFLANMSHELRTPLNAVIGFSELLEQEIFGTLLPRQKEYVQNVLTSGQHLLSLVNDVLDISKVEAGRMDLNRDWTPLGVVVDSVDRILQSLASKKGVALQLTQCADLPEGYIDPVRIKQVLYNLLANGIKFTPAGGAVRLTAQVRGASIELEVEDSGVGIRAEDLPRLFRPFEQFISSAQELTEGSGLGLALTRSLVELHGGTISVRSKVGVGSTFTVSLPVLRPSTVAERLADPARDEPLVLVVDHDPQTAGALKNHLSSLGLTGQLAVEAEAGLRVANELRPALIVLNAQMPGIENGWGMLDRLKKNSLTASIPMLAVSALDEPNRALYLGAMDYLVKPISLDHLAKALERMGVTTYCIRDTRILLVGEKNPELEKIVSCLRPTDCDIRFSGSLTREAVARHAPVDLVAGAVKALLGAEKGVPILAFAESPEECSQEARENSTCLEYRDALQPGRLVRTIRRLIDQSRLAGEIHAGTGLPSRSRLLAHLKTTIARAEREQKRFVILAIEVQMPEDVQSPRWADLLPPHLRPDDFIAVAAPDVLAMVAFNIDEGHAGRLAIRFPALLQTLCRADPHETRRVWYPKDGWRAEELLNRCCQSPVKLLAGTG
jgi:signal transduction histidine kinase/DNA-binding response OmpR family regulator